ncbi:Bzz1p [Kluyveromyces lactis]|uniref:Protein BZZ1 n=1 Tax=Kluyveromyces lactis (strain ATCC 8585 / CBS 2359 / DSM 70799 / NBRC 1267 / NRRL Y-1140 / WM37) TaxID=284590 RepID=Q6CIU7_KLULA|nr:uncharacterized protein KLLA0_F23848g [Kluyveromyces lactis]CAG98850.1 KLLA0F23848p [Kluyveromyces lactis]|eukprot:XP_456142.1 uncharacterized protein KLLA0_F23848g [Kluyveromyces lactis]
MSESISVGNEIKEGFPETNKWVQNNVKWLSTVESFYHERSKLEKEYSEKLRQLTKEYFAKKSAETVALSVGNSPTTTPGSLECASQVAWNEVLSQTELIAKDHEKFSNDIAFHICEQLKTLTNRCNSLVISAEKLNAEVSGRKTTCYENLEKAKKRYYDSCQVMETARSKSSKSSSEKAQRRQAEKEHEMNISKNDYLTKINQANRVKDKYFFQDVPEILDILQDINESRAAMLNIIWNKAGVLERELNKTIDSRLDAADSVIAKNKPYLDTSMFIKHNMKSWKEPKDFLYEPSSVWHDDEHFVVNSQVELQDLRVKLAKAQQQLQQTQYHIESEKKSLGQLNTDKCNLKAQEQYDPMQFQDILKNYISSVSGFTALEHKKLEAEVEAESIQNNVADDSVLDTSEVDLSQPEKKHGLLGKFKQNLTISSTLNPIATKTSTNNNSDTISMVSAETQASKKSNRFSIFKKVGRSKRTESTPFDDDSVSVVPSNAESFTPSQEVSYNNDDTVKNTPTGIRAKVLYSYTKSDADEVSVNGDTVVTVLNKDAGNGWSLIKLDTGEQGLVPETYIQLQQSTTPSTSRAPPPRAPQPRKSAQKTMTAAYPYQSQGPDELSLQVGDKIKVLKEDEGNGWTFGELNGTQGLFPTTYCS